MKKIKNIVLLSLIPLSGFAQTNGGGDFFSNIGKIYVVVGVILILFIGIIGFLVYLERKVAKLEHEIED